MAATLQVEAEQLGHGASSRIHVGTVVVSGGAGGSAEAGQRGRQSSDASILLPSASRRRSSSGGSESEASAGSGRDTPASGWSTGHRARVLALPTAVVASAPASDDVADRAAEPRERRVAVKIVYDSQDSLQREIEALRIVGDHPNVVALECDELVLVEVGGGDHSGEADADAEDEGSASACSDPGEEDGSCATLDTAETASSALISNGDVCMLTELCEGDLLGLVESEGGPGLALAVALPLFGQLCAAVAHCHENGVYHCDIKPENVLLHDGVAKLSDFGACTFHRFADQASVSQAHFGSLEFLAPELLAVHADGRRTAMLSLATSDGRGVSFGANGDGAGGDRRGRSRVRSRSASLVSDHDIGYGDGDDAAALSRSVPRSRMRSMSRDAPFLLEGKCVCGGYSGGEVDFAAVDVWALGVLLLSVVTGEQPWGRAHLSDLAFSRYVNDELHFDYVQRDVRELVKAMLNPDPCARPTAAQVSQISWLRSGEPPNSMSPRSGAVVLTAPGKDLSPALRGVPPSMASRIVELPDDLCAGLGGGPRVGRRRRRRRAS